MLGHKTEKTAYSFLQRLRKDAAGNTFAMAAAAMFPIAGLAYEVNRWAADHLDNAVVRALVSPGFLMQRLTTREPTDEMLEVSLTSLRAALNRHEAGEPGDSFVVYRDFAEICTRLA